jgi:hypothetical protein
MGQFAGWQPEAEQKGDPERMLGVSLDITERKLAEEKLREYEKAVVAAFFLCPKSISFGGSLLVWRREKLVR